MIKIVHKRWGKEEWIINDEYCGKILSIKKDASSSIHYHKLKKETFYILSGKVKLDWYPFKDYIRRKQLICSVTLERGQSFTLYQYTVHRFSGLAVKNEILEISTHHENSDSYRIKERKRIR